MEKADIRQVAKWMLGKAISTEYLDPILDLIMDDVFEDVQTFADPVQWDEYDIKLAIGKVLRNKLGIDG